jgi:hypothetical protein
MIFIPTIVLTVAIYGPEFQILVVKTTVNVCVPFHQNKIFLFRANR